MMEGLALAFSMSCPAWRPVNTTGQFCGLEELAVTSIESMFVFNTSFSFVYRNKTVVTVTLSLEHNNISHIIQNNSKKYKIILELFKILTLRLI